MNRILVATDGSESADRAIDYAAHRAKTEGAELVIANIAGGLSDRVFSSFTHAQQTWFAELVSSVSAETLDKAKERARSIGVSAIHLESRTGDIVQALIETAQEKQVHSIIVGKRGTGRVAGLLLGSVSQKLVSLAPLPVTVIP
jgi:nucleotide-binding universal stress UspA family protein